MWLTSGRASGRKTLLQYSSLTPLERECYEGEVHPYRKTDYKPMIYILFLYIIFRYFYSKHMKHTENYSEIWYQICVSWNLNNLYTFYLAQCCHLSHDFNLYNNYGVRKCATHHSNVVVKMLLLFCVDGNMVISIIT